MRGKKNGKVCPPTKGHAVRVRAPAPHSLLVTISAKVTPRRAPIGRCSCSIKGDTVVSGRSALVRLEDDFILREAQASGGAEEAYRRIKERLLLH